MGGSVPEQPSVCLREPQVVAGEMAQRQRERNATCDQERGGAPRSLGSLVPFER
jgi:hypothetical protein